MTTTVANPPSVPPPTSTRTLGAALALAILALGVAYVASTRFDGLGAFNLDGEYNVPSFFSASVLLAAAAAAWSVRAVVPRARLWGAALATLFAAMALDEVVSVHENLEGATGLDWMTLYAPLALAGGVAWLVALRVMSRRGDLLAAGLWVAGAAAWVIAQGLEALQWHGDVKASGYFKMMPVEEVLEMAGSAAFLLALLAVHAGARPDNDQGGAERRAAPVAASSAKSSRFSRSAS